LGENPGEFWAQMSVTSHEAAVYEVLSRLGIAYARLEHPPVYTVEQARQYDADLPGAHCKNLFLRNKKGDRYYLAVLHAGTQVSLNELGERVGERGLSFASAERLMNCLGVEPGAVGPFGLLHSGAREVTVIMDSFLREFKQIGFHPNINTCTLTLTVRDFESFLTAVGNRVVWI
jgi:Ala-tRNA(Pro) deacylase